MLGSVPTETGEDRRPADAEERLTRIESALDSVKCAPPECRAPRIHAFITTCDREIRQWRAS